MTSHHHYHPLAFFLTVMPASGRASGKAKHDISKSLTFVVKTCFDLRSPILIGYGVLERTRVKVLTGRTRVGARSVNVPWSIVVRCLLGLQLHEAFPISHPVPCDVFSLY